MIITCAGSGNYNYYLGYSHTGEDYTTGADPGLQKRREHRYYGLVPSLSHMCVVRQAGYKKRVQVQYVAEADGSIFTSIFVVDQISLQW